MVRCRQYTTHHFLILDHIDFPRFQASIPDTSLWSLHNIRSHEFETKCRRHEGIYDFITFYTPVWNTDVLCRGNVRPSVRPSAFSGLSSTCFEIYIRNLVYTFSRWHDISSLSCITIVSLWPTLQPKVGQTHLFAIMASEIKINSSNLVHRWPAVYSSPLAPSYSENNISGMLAIIFERLGF